MSAETRHDATMWEGAALIDAGPKPDAAIDAAPAAPAAHKLPSLEDLVRLHAPRITRLVHRLMGWRRDDVDDLVQEVFLAALQHRQGFRGDASVATWLTRIAVNKCRSRQRTLRTLWKRFLGTSLDESAVPAPEQPGGHCLELTETSRRVRQAVQALPPRDREVVVLRYFDELSLDAVAGVTGQSKNAVEVRLHRARARLAEALRNVVTEEGRE